MLCYCHWFCCISKSWDECFYLEIKGDDGKVFPLHLFICVYLIFLNRCENKWVYNLQVHLTAVYKVCHF